MTTFFGLLASIAFFIAILVCPIAWCCAVYYLFRTVNATELGRDVWKRPPGMAGWFYNPCNRILDSSQLTPDGLHYRRRLILSSACFIIPILAVLLFADLGGMRHEQ